MKIFGWTGNNVKIKYLAKQSKTKESRTMGKPKNSNNKLELFDYNFPEDRQYSEGNKNQDYYNKIKNYNEEKRKARTSRVIEKVIFWSFAIAAILVTVLSIYLLKNSLENSSPTFPEDNKIIVGSANLSTTIIGEQQSKTISTTKDEPSTTTSTSQVQQVIPTVEQTSATTSVLTQSSTTESSKISETTTIEEETEIEHSETTSTTVKQITTTQHSETEKPSKTTVKPTTEKLSETTTEPTTSKQEYIYHIRFYIKSTKTNKVLGYYTSEMSEAEVSKVYKFANEQLAAESLDGETGTYYIVEEEYKVQK